MTINVQKSEIVECECENTLAFNSDGLVIFYITNYKIYPMLNIKNDFNKYKCIV